MELAAEDGVYSLVSLLVETFHLEGRGGRNRTVEGRKEGRRRGSEERRGGGEEEVKRERGGEE